MRTPTPRGFTLIETMLAIVVLAIGLLGIVAGLLTSARTLREGQLTQFKGSLVDASIQRIRLQPKAQLFAQASAALASDPLLLLPGQAPWAPEPSAWDGSDLGTGAYFRIESDGTIKEAQGIVPGTVCSDVPADVYCRERVISRGPPPPPNGAAVPPALQNADAVTVWVRVARGGDRLGSESTRMEVIVQ